MSQHELLLEILAKLQVIENLKEGMEKAVENPDHCILDDVDLCAYLKVSKRTTATWREKGMIDYSQPSGKVFYTKSQVLQFIKKYNISGIDPRF